MATAEHRRTADRQGTRERVVQAAAELFAAHGFHGATVRDIAARARVNLAATNYHFGSKRELYLAVLREQFDLVRRAIGAAGADFSEAELDRMSRRQLEDLFDRRSRAMFQLLLGPEPSLHATLMARELLDPTEALAVIVSEFVRPMVMELETLVRRLAPELDAGCVERCAMSVVGQALFYRNSLPALEILRRESRRPGPTIATLSSHVVRFSLGGMAALRRAPVSGRAGATAARRPVPGVARA